MLSVKIGSGSVGVSSGWEIRRLRGGASCAASSGKISGSLSERSSTAAAGAERSITSPSTTSSVFRRRRLVYRRQHDGLFHRRGVGRREISSRIRGILIFPAATACAEEVLGSAGRLKLVGGRGRHRKLGRSVRNLEFGGGGGLYVQQVVRMVRRLELRTNRGTNIDLRRLLVTEHFDTEVGRRV